MKDYDLVLFDLGGLLVNPGGMRQFMELTGLDPEEIRRRWLDDESLISYETGQMTDLEFAEHLVSAWRLPFKAEAFLEEMRSWPSELYPGARELLEQAKQRLPTGCLTNTNPILWPKIRDDLGLGLLLDHHFVSFEMGYVKPAGEVYDYVVNRTGLQPGRILFFDDLEANVKGGRQAGFDSYRVDNVTQIREIMVMKGIIGSPEEFQGLRQPGPAEPPP